MFKKKLVALGLCLSMAASLAACGSDDGKSESKATGGQALPTKASPREEKEMASAIDDHSAVAENCIATFEDGNAPFISVNDTDWGKDADLTTSVIDKFGSKMFDIEIPNKGNPSVAIDIVSLLGDNASKAKTISIDLGLNCKDDKFAAASGHFLTYAGEENSEIKTSFAVYKREACVKTFKIDLGDMKLTAGNYITFDKIDDVAAKASGILLDNIIVYDASGNALPLNTSAEFAVEGVGEYDWSNMVQKPVDEKIILVGETTGNGWWPTKGNSWSFVAETEGDAYKYCYKPEDLPITEDMVITIYYTVTDPASTENYQAWPYLRAQNWTVKDDDGNVIVDDDNSGWYDKIIDIFAEPKYEDDGTPTEESYVNKTRTIAQITYDHWKACFDKGNAVDCTDLSVIDFIGVADRGKVLNISAVTYGKVAK